MMSSLRWGAATGLLLALAPSCKKGTPNGDAPRPNADVTPEEVITIGASIPLSGPLAGFGSFQKWGYQRAVDEANAQGGLDIAGKHRKIKLILLDDKTDANTTSSNVDRLIAKENAHALLGSCTPALVNAGAVVADRNKKPMVTGCAPLEAFKSVKKWTYVWDLFFHEPDLARAPFRTLVDLGVETNNKVAILHDNGPDGQVVGGQLWPKLAKEAGYQVAFQDSFPVESTEFGGLIEKVKSSGADVLLVDAVTPQAVSIRKQMSARNFAPKVLVIEKGAEPAQFAEALGPLAEGVIVGGYWDPSFAYPGARDLREQFERESKQTFSQHIADSYSAAKVLIDAIAAAQSTEPEKINAALALTNKTYVVGPIQFDAEHTAKLPVVELQWQSGKTQVIWPKSAATGKLLFPLPH